MQQYFGLIEGLCDIDEVLELCADLCEKQGVLRQNYHFTPLFDAPNSKNTVVYYRGFGRDWIKKYEDEGLRQHDPIPFRTMLHGQILGWRDAAKRGENTPENESFFDALRDFDLIHGFGIPLFGPRGRNAYASFDFGMPFDEVPDAQLGTVRSVAQAGHQRLCMLLDTTQNLPELTEREAQVLHWIVNGKSASVIADILQISPDTVKTYTKRIYSKLGASDRVGAAVKALKLGLVTA